MLALGVTLPFCMVIVQCLIFISITCFLFSLRGLNLGHLQGPEHVINNPEISWTQADAERILLMVPDGKWNKYSKQKLKGNVPGGGLQSRLFVMLYFSKSCDTYTFCNVCRISFYRYERFACIYICTPHLCVLTTESRRNHQSPWSWVSRGLLAALRVLGTQPRFSRRSSKCSSYLSCDSSLRLQYLKCLLVRGTRWPIPGP